MIKVFYWILLLLDSVVYNFINYAYQIFLLLTRIVFADEAMISEFIKRVYTVIGVVMLFIIAYSFLKAIVSPDNNGVKSMGKVVFNVVKAIILLALVPPLFDFAYAVQDAILNQNTIGRIILGNGDKDLDPADTIHKGGMELSSTMLKAFIFSKDNYPEEEWDKIDLAGDNTYKLSEVWDSIDSAQTFRYITLFSDELALDEDSKIDYNWLISTVAACYILYLLVSYCLSLGLRVIKLLFYELLAPIPILASILPNKKDMFNKWLSTTLTTYIEVFLRIAIMYLTIYIAALLKKINYGGVLDGQTNGMIESLAIACVLMGLVTFVKKAPELISEITGLDSSKMSAGIKEQLKSGGGLIAASAIGGAVTTGTRNAINGVRRIAATKKNWEEANKLTGKDKHKARLKALGSSIGAGVGSVGSILGGTISGGARAGKAGKDAGSFADIKEAAKKGSGDAVEARNKRASYKAYHGGTFKSGIGHITDSFKNVGDWASGETVEGLQAQSKSMEELASSYTNARDAIENSLVKEQAKGDKSAYLSNGFNEITGFNSAYINLSEATDDYEQAKRDFSLGRIDASKLAAAKQNMKKANDDVIDIIMNESFNGRKGAAYQKLSIKGQSIMNDFIVDTETIKAKVTENAGSSVVQSFDGLLKAVRTNNVTVDSFENSNGDKLKDVALKAKGEADIKLAEKNKENAAKGDSK